MADVAKVVIRVARETSKLVSFNEWRKEWASTHGITLLFENGYSADIVDTGYGSDEGLLETAVMYDGNIVYDTPITNDVIGWQDEEEAVATALEIANLPPR